jgi:hypothetical protein
VVLVVGLLPCEPGVFVVQALDVDTVMIGPTCVFLNGVRSVVPQGVPPPGTTLPYLSV